jgi:predicted phosphodiesterase
MRVALVSDIHGNLPALRAVAAAIEAARADLVLNLGDIASGPLWPRETVALLAERGWLASLPAALEACEGELRAFHGVPGDDRRGLLETVTPGYAPGADPGVRPATEGEVDRRLAGTRAAVLVCGHTHTPRARRLADGTLVVNPGSVGRPAYAHDRPHRHVVEAGTPHARWALLERSGDGWHAELQQTAYDWDVAARRAAALGFADWAHELVTGRTRPGCFS